MYQRRNSVCIMLTICLLVHFFTGCVNTENKASIPENINLENIESEKHESEKDESENSSLGNPDTKNIIAEDGQGASETENTTSEPDKMNSNGSQEVSGPDSVLSENVNKGMEDKNAMDIVRNMRIGWNIGNTLDSTRADISRTEQPIKFETAWGNPQVTQELIDTVIDAGFNVIRIPVSWTNHIAPAPEYTVAESWMGRVKEVVDYAYNKGVYVIVNVHHEDWNYPYYDNLERASAEMEAVWRQIAEVFKDYDEHLIFEGQNEPRKVGTPMEWNGGDEEGWEVVNKTNKVFIDTVRSTGGSNPYRMLMVPGYAANCTDGIKHIEIPENDNRVIVSVHAYEPYDFALKLDGRSEWNHDTVAIDKMTSDLKTLFIDENIPVIIGEFGAMNRENDFERSQWAEYYVSETKKIGVPCIWWDNGLFQGDGERFGLFDRRTGECKYPDILAALMRGTE